MTIRIGLMVTTLSCCLLGISGSANSTPSQGLGTWEGSGTATDVSGRELGGFSVSVTRKPLANGKVRADASITLANGTNMTFWQEFETRGPGAFHLVSSHGTGGGRCFANGMCQTLEQTPDGHGYATTIVPDGNGKLRILITELDDGSPLRFFQQTLYKK